jgi:hypothetical protein
MYLGELRKETIHGEWQGWWGVMIERKLSSNVLIIYLGRR